MLLRKVNSITRKRSGGQRLANHRDIGNVPITDAQTGFIQHRHGFPLQYKCLYSDSATKDGQGQDSQNSIGLLFQADEYLKPGTTIEATITVQDKPETFCGKVVMVRDHGNYYEIGLWLGRHEDACRARIVEQSCYIEAYIKEKKYRDGPFVLNRDGAAEEWISKYAAGVPGQ